MMDTQTILALIGRHALTTAAGFLIAHGYLNSSGTEQFIAAGMLLAGVGWSWWQKTGQKAALADLVKFKKLLEISKLPTTPAGVASIIAAVKGPTTAAAVRDALANKP